MKIHFDHTDGGLVVKGDKLGEFSMAGADRKWYWADARIEGDAIIVSSQVGPEPGGGALRLAVVSHGHAVQRRRAFPPCLSGPTIGRASRSVKRSTDEAFRNEDEMRLKSLIDISVCAPAIGLGLVPCAGRRGSQALVPAARRRVDAGPAGGQRPARCDGFWDRPQGTHPAQRGHHLVGREARPEQPGGA